MGIILLGVVLILAAIIIAGGGICNCIEGSYRTMGHPFSRLIEKEENPVRFWTHIAIVTLAATLLLCLGIYLIVEGTG